MNTREINSSKEQELNKEIEYLKNELNQSKSMRYEYENQYKIVIGMLLLILVL